MELVEGFAIKESRHPVIVARAQALLHSSVVALDLPSHLVHLDNPGPVHGRVACHEILDLDRRPFRFILSEVANYYESARTVTGEVRRIWGF